MLLLHVWAIVSFFLSCAVDQLLMKGVKVVVYTAQLDLIVDTLGKFLSLQLSIGKRSEPS